jgi:hypothetical protein
MMEIITLIWKFFLEDNILSRHVLKYKWMLKVLKDCAQQRRVKSWNKGVTALDLSKNCARMEKIT